jgi:hypothetical protein
MQVKTPITEADSIRMLACKALAGLSRSGTVSQIISRLPIITDGHLQCKLLYPSIIFTLNWTEKTKINALLNVGWEITSIILRRVNKFYNCAIKIH